MTKLTRVTTDLQYHEYVYFDTVADFFAASLADVRKLAGADTGTAYVEVKRGRHQYEVDLTQTAAHNTPAACTVKATVLPTESGYDVRAFGAKGDGVLETLAVQAAMDAAGTGGKVVFPDPPVHYLVSSLQLYRSQTLQGSGREDPVLVGDGTDVLVKTNVYGASTNVRAIKLLDMSIENSNFDTVQLHGSPNATIQRCEIHCNGAMAISQKLSVRCHINYNKITTAGSPKTWELLDNCNGSDTSHNIVSPGSQAGAVAVDVGTTQVLDMDNITLEVCDGVGVRVGGDVVGGGNCSGISMRNWYFEQVKRPFEIGLKYSILGIDISGFYIGNVNDNHVSSYDNAIHIGRVVNLELSHAYPNGHGTESLFEFYDVTNGAGPNPFLENSRIAIGLVNGYASYFAKNAAFTVARENRIFGKNDIRIMTETPIGIEREWVSEPYDAGSTVPFKTIIPATDGGAMITAVDILDATGDIDCTFQLGTSVVANELALFNPSTFTLTEGYARAQDEDANEFLRVGEAARGRVVAGSGSGTFRIRVRYRN